jgi:hypothetical protein
MALRIRLVPSVALTFAAVLATSGSLLAKEGAAWLPTFGSGSSDPFDGAVEAVTVFDDGSGPALYAAGFFDNVDGTFVNGVARWDGSSWSPVGGGLGVVIALAALDDGSGEALYATAADAVWRLDGSSWSSLGAAFSSTPTSMVVFDDGSGSALYTGGWFETVGGLSARRVAKWNGTTWEALGLGTNGIVWTLAVFDDGDGPALYAGGEFNAAGGLPAPRVASWDGTSWSPVGAGVNGPVWALTVYDDGSGADLIAGGEFTVAGGQPASLVARWDGTAWSALGAGVGVPANPSPTVFALSTFNDGNGEELIAGGFFDDAGGLDANGIARWDGTTWHAMPGSPAPLVHSVRAFTVFDDGTGERLFGGGRASGRGFVHGWRDEDWIPTTLGLDGQVNGLLRFDDSSGQAVCAVGRFRFAGGQRVNRVARWDGTTWSPFGDGFDDTWFSPSGTHELNDVEVFDGDLYVVGNFSASNGAGIARWTGTTWSEVGGQNLINTGYALQTFDDGSGPALFVGGVGSVARWDGTSWSELGGALGHVRELIVYDDGSGPALHYGNRFSSGRVERWDGVSWTQLGNDLSYVYDLTVFDSGSGPLLYAANSDGIVFWSGSAWLMIPFVGPSGFATTGYPRALAAFDDGTGEALYYGGLYDEGDTDELVRFDGTDWVSIGSFDESFSVETLVPLDGVTFGNPALFVGGDFTDTDGTGDAYLARYGCAVPPTTSYCFGDGTGDPCPCGNTGAPGHGCDIPAGTGGIELTVENWDPDFAGGGLADFVGAGFPPMATGAAHLIRSPSAQAPATVFGDGLLCVAPAGLVRINAVLSSGGVSLNAAMHGAGAGTFYYQLWVRSQPIMFCDPNAAFNLSNGVELTWP